MYVNAVHAPEAHSRAPFGLALRDCSETRCRALWMLQNASKVQGAWCIKGNDPRAIVADHSRALLFGFPLVPGFRQWDKRRRVTGAAHSRFGHF